MSKRVKAILAVIVMIVISATISYQLSKREGEKATTTEEEFVYTPRTDDESTGLVFDVMTDSGDELHVTINNKKTNTMELNEEEKSIVIRNEDREDIQHIRFLTEDWYAEYYNTAMADCEVIISEDFANMWYTLYSYNKDGKTMYEILAWIEGSNTGLLVEANSDKDEIKDLYTDLSFEITETDQTDEYYICIPETTASESDTFGN